MTGPISVSALLLALAASAPFGRAQSPDNLEFFEAKIRPVLVEKCQKCHSEKAATAGKLRGGLRLDTAAGWQKGGDNGKAIVPGKPGEGTLLKSLRHEGDIQMPPDGKLPDAVVADFETWIKAGAVDPRTDPATTVKVAGIDLGKGRQFWSLQPPKTPAVPTTGEASVIDRFIRAKWDEKGLRPVAAADKRTLIRRVTFDLTGLPPTPEEVDTFLRDESPVAWEKLVERLLQSPRYGERWGRYWLDVARYAEDQAHTFAVTPKKNAYLYRDWVIEAFNKDMPYDQFVRLQIAGDLQGDYKDDLFTKLAGLGFLGLGAEYYKNTAREQAIAEELDDRVDTLTRGFLGLTVSCARCHDHKFDPIPTRDYYSLAGIFYGSNLTEAPLVSADKVRQYADAQAKVKAAEEVVNRFLGDAGKAAAKEAVALTSKYLLAARKVRLGKAKATEVAQSEGLNRYFLDRWLKFLDPANAAKTPALFKDWFGLPADAKSEEVEKAATAVQGKLIAVELPDYVPAKNGKNTAKSADPLAKAMFLDQAAPLFVAAADAERLFVKSESKAKLTELRADVEQQKKASPPAPLTAHVLSGGEQGMKVYIRGNPATKGEDAPKGFLQVLSKPGTNKPFTRLDLANAIASPDNPLTARVIVNRVWAWRFGRGLVNTPSNFGSLGDRPTHPELLDYLAVEFMKNGWSLKWLHKQLLLTNVYRLAAEPNADDAKTDGGNVYLWRGGRKRLDVEAWRDSLLFVSGALDETTGGPTYDLRNADAKRRTVYAKVSRHELDGLLRLFDFPDANVTADRRNVTTVPQQQLFALNSDFMVNQAKAFAARVEKFGKTDAERVTAAYRLAFNRVPSEAETKLAEGFLKKPAKPTDTLTRWQQYAQALLASNEFLYLD